MRELDDREKELLRRIQSGVGKNLYSLIGEWTKGVGFWVTRSKGDLKIRFNTGNPANASLDDRVTDIQTIVLQCVMLIKQLEERYVIHTMQSVHSPEDEFAVGEWTTDPPFIERVFPDVRVSELFCRYSTVEIIPTRELKKFIDDDFRSPEAVRADRQYALTRTAFKYSRLAFWVAAAGFVLNALVQGCNVKRSTSSEGATSGTTQQQPACHGTTRP